MQVTTSQGPPLNSSREAAAKVGGVAGRGGAPGAAASASYRRAASSAMAAEMSVAVMDAPLKASGMASDPVPHPASQTDTPARGDPPSQPRTFSTVWAWPSRMSRWTELTSSDSE
jgi:hypothetical protein